MNRKKRDENKFESQYQYKCRYCGKIYSPISSGLLNMHNQLVNAIHKVTVNNQPPVYMLHVHLCDDGECGIGDLIGAIAVKV